MMVASSHCVLWISKRQRGLLSRQAARVLSHRSWHELMDGSDDVAKLHETKKVRGARTTGAQYLFYRMHLTV